MYSNGDGRVLLVGGNNGLFAPGQEPSPRNFDIIPDLESAVEAASGGLYTVVAVVMSSFGNSLGQALRTLRAACAGGRIILLARAFEEPLAFRLAFGLDTSPVADDYLIRPVNSAGILAVGCNMDAVTSQRLSALELLATEDDVTGLKNRRYIRQFARQIIDRAGTCEGRVTLLVFDIDDFKRYNDLYGHATGDDVLRQAAVLIRNCCRRHDVVGRIGGDEFAVVFWDDPGMSNGSRPAERRSVASDHPTEPIFVANRFLGEIKKTRLQLLGPEGKGVLTISGGLASYPRDGFSVEELFEKADEALLAAKRSGKNRIYLVGSPNGDISEMKG